MDAIRVGTIEELQKAGQLLTKVENRPVLVVWHEGSAHALDDRCPHLGFPLHQGSIESGLVTCHWHHARFDLSSGCTLDPWADDAEGYDVELRDGEVLVAPRPVRGRAAGLHKRLQQGLEDGLTLVTAKATLGLVDGGTPAVDILRTGLTFGARQRASGWGAGMTVLVAMGNVAPVLNPASTGLALVHGLAFVARDVAGQPPRYTLDPLSGSGASAARLTEWYRRFVDSRNGDGAERALATMIERNQLVEAEMAMFAAATDHVFIDGGHTLDFTNKAFEALGHIGVEHAGLLLPTLVGETAAAERAEESLEWRHPIDLVALAREAEGRLPEALASGDAARLAGRALRDEEVGELGWRLLADDPEDVVDHLVEALSEGATHEQVARAVAFAAALRITRFHTQNDHADWNEVHHAFTTANAVHQAIGRRPTVELLRGVIQGALRVYLDRFMNIPAARLPRAATGGLALLGECWDRQGAVDEAGGLVYGHLRSGGDPAEVLAILGAALLAEDAGFHWYQVYEAAVRQHSAWPAGSEEGRLILVGLARFLAAHTPTRRELPRVVNIARRLRRGEPLYEANEAAEDGSAS
jgi:nitrite reductase/ring-hydroxylating ferredoxin subunit